MKILFNVPDEQVDEIVVESLREVYRLNCKPDKIDNSDEVIPPDNDLLDAVDLILKYFQTPVQQQDWEMEKWDI